MIPQAIFSRNFDKANTIAKKYDIPEIYTDWKKLIQSETIDFVSIVLPTWLHSEVIKYTRQFNKPFICEAPFMSTKEIKELLDNNNRLEIIDYELRFLPHFTKMKELIEDNQIGKIVSFNFEYLSNYGKDPEIRWDWSYNIELGGGHLNLVGGHFIDLANFFFGEYEKIIESEFYIYKTEREDYNGKLKKVTADDQAFLKIKYLNEITGTILISQMSEDDENPCIIVKGTEGVLKIKNNELFISKNDNFQKVILSHDKKLFAGLDNNLFTIGSYFLGKKIKEYLEKNENFKYPNLEDSLKNQEIIEKAYKSLPNNELSCN